MKKQFENNRQLILYFIKGSKTYFILAILFAAAASLFDLINPRIISFTVDSVIGSKKASLPESTEKVRLLSRSDQRIPSGIHFS